MIEMGPIDNNFVGELAFAIPSFSLYFFVNLACTLAVMAICCARFFRNNFVVVRLAFSFSFFVCVFYQIPLMLFSDSVELTLRHHWAYSFVVNGFALGMLSYSFVSSKLDIRLVGFSSPSNFLNAYLLVGLVALIFLSIYLYQVPWVCTGFFALLFDPWLTLLAREFGVKIVGTSVGTYALGAYVNTIGPIFILLSIWLVKNAIAGKKVFVGILGGVGGFFAVGALLISGAKGSLASAAVMLAVGSYYWSVTWPRRFLMVFASVLFLGAALLGFEIFKERGSMVGANYDFAACSARVGTCSKSAELLSSMSHRDYSLGLPNKFVKPIQDRLTCLCARDGYEAPCPSGSTEGRPDVPSNLRLLTFFEAIVERIFVVPFRVSVWTFMYSETEVVDGYKTLPFSRRLFGESLNIPEMVYQKYGALYSQGDRTSTSTAPTGFFLGYPAFLGLGGLLIAMVCVVLLDLLLAVLAKFIGPKMLPLLIGLILVMVMNFMSSDFVTVIVSHGAGVGIFLLAALGVLNRKRV